MSKYSVYGRRPQIQPRPWDVHPVWRGIGCLFIILIPILSYAGAVLLVQENAKSGWIPIPPDLAKTITIPFVGAVPYLYANLMTAFVLAVIIYGVLVTLYIMVYSILGPPRLSPLDAPPERSSSIQRRK